MRNRIGRRSLVGFWVLASFFIASYYNACGKVSFETTSSSRLNDMLSSAIVLINNDDPYTKSTAVEVALNSNQSDEVYLTNDATCDGGGQWQALTDRTAWTLGARNREVAVYAKFRNTHEGLETPCISDSIVHDDMAPLVVLANPVSATNVATPILNFVASDDLSGVAGVKCQWPGQKELDCKDATANGNLNEGRYIVKVVATDVAGNVSDPQSFDLTVDRTPPVITMLTQPPSLSNLTNAAFSFNVTDDRSGVKSIECAWENESAYAACASPLNRTVPAGAHKLFVRARDMASNEAKIAIDFAVDLTVPTVSITAGPDDFSRVNTASFTFTGNVAGQPLARFECRLDAGAYAACTSPRALTALSEGQHTFYVRGYSAAGNVSAPAMRTWYVDSTAPVVTIVSSPTAFIKTANATVRYSITDSGSGVLKAECNVDAAGFKACNVDSLDLSGLTEAKHTVVIRGYDKAGNTGDSSQVAFTVDLRPPTIQLTDVPSAISNLAAFTFKYVAADANGVDRVECKLDGAAYAPCASQTANPVAGLTEGNHVFLVRAIDQAGNVSAEARHAWMVDLSGPTISYFQLPPSSALATAVVKLGFTVEDLGSGVKSLACTLDNAAIACQSGVLLTLPSMPAGSHVFKVTAVDNAGNTATDMKTIVISPAVSKDQLVDVKPNGKLDVLVIVDNSGSMKSEQANMAARFSMFVQQLNGLDWQVGIITTDMDQNKDPIKRDGNLVELNGMAGQFVLTSAVPAATAQTVFGNTVQMGVDGSGAELGFKAAIRAIDRAFDGTTQSAPNKMLFRDGAALAAIVLSDAYDNSGTKPEDVINKVKTRFPGKAFAWHSLVVPSDYTDTTKDAKVNPNDPCKSYRESVAYDGRDYLRLSALTGGVQGNECTDDYGSQLKDIGKISAELVKSVSLDCVPLDVNGDGKVDYNDVKVIDPKGVSIQTFTVSGQKLTFTDALPEGKNRVQYVCVP